MAFTDEDIAFIKKLTEERQESADVGLQRRALILATKAITELTTERNEAKATINTLQGLIFKANELIERQQQFIKSKGLIPPNVDDLPPLLN
jgi:hypothetical protein